VRGRTMSRIFASPGPITNPKATQPTIGDRLSQCFRRAYWCTTASATT
jgi:hypothetical protein